MDSKQIDSCWAETAAALNRASPKIDRRRCLLLSREMLQTAAFLHLCRRRGLLPKASAEETLHNAVARLPAPLFDPSPIDLDAWQKAFSATAPIDGPPEILADVYRRLLGRKLIDDGRGGFKAAAEPHAAKAGGVFYTPPVVAQYITENALASFYADPARAGGSPTAPQPLIPALLDPACGCGVFLLTAFRSLCSHLNNGADAKPSPAAILRCIHGVDVDAQAVLVARRCLWLELMSTERTSPAVPPDDAMSINADFLAHNVCAADALGDDCFASADGQTKRFDVIVGNPPYLRELGAKRLLDRLATTRLGRRWRTPRMDLWFYFVHRGLELLGEGGVLSFIVSGYWTSTGAGAAKLLAQLKSETHVEEIFDLDRLDVFPNVSGLHMIIRLLKKPGDLSHFTTIQRIVPFDAFANMEKPPDLAAYFTDESRTVVYEKTHRQLFRKGSIDMQPPDEDFFAIFTACEPLGDLGKVRQGIAENPAWINNRTNEKFGNRWRLGEGVFSLSRQEAAALKLSEAEKRLLRPYYCLGDLGRYRIAAPASRLLIYSTAETWPDFAMHPALGAHLQRFRPLMDERRETQQGRRPWWQLHWPREDELWRSPKIICPQMAVRPSTVPAGGDTYVSFSANVFLPSAEVGEHLYYFAALLNSSLLWQWFLRRAKRRGIGLEINCRALAEAPIRRIDFTAPADRARHDRLVALVEKMLEASNGSFPHSSLFVAAEIDGEINAVVDDLYGLSQSRQ